jgi:hypothetical protein
MFFEHRVVDDRTFLLGLDKLYLDAMKQHERGELLRCARRVAGALNAIAAKGPVEGYYAEDQQLTEYFQLVRALQEIDEKFAPTVTALPEFQRLRDVMSAPLYGNPTYGDKLLPTGRDALSQALLNTSPNWTLKGLTTAACSIARRADEFSLVGLAARLQDSVVLTAARESVVLYAEIMPSNALFRPPPRYVWKVDKELAKLAKRFIDTFNLLFGEALPPPEPVQAQRYWDACHANEIFGRCVRLGCDISSSAMRHYHWAISRAADGELVVRDFWNSEVWTTERYRATLRGGGRCPWI